MEAECLLSSQQSPPLDRIPNQLNPVHTLKACFLKIHFNSSFPSTPRSFKRSSFRVFRIKFGSQVYSHVCYIPNISHSSFYHPKNLTESINDETSDNFDQSTEKLPNHPVSKHDVCLRVLPSEI
jgi:hypothetical protein